MHNSDSTAAAVISKTCAGTTYSIVITTSQDDQKTFALFRQAGAMQREQIKPPTEMDGYGPVALGCSVTPAGNAYFTVQYGEESGTGCTICEWFYLYDADGKQLTTSVPTVLEDATLPATQRQYPNNQEYQAKLSELGLNHPDMDYRP